MELYKKYRPKKLTEVCGQDLAVKQLAGFLKKKKVPHAILFCGGSGVGKTTLARIMATELGCTKAENDIDCQEINSANFRGIDTVRYIQDQSRYAPHNGVARVWILDEFHKATKDAQTNILKALEDSNDFTYFFLCTTEPHKLLKTIHTRCTKISLSDLTEDEIRAHLERILKAEKTEISSKTLEAIVRAGKGSARLAAVRLEQVLALEDGDQMPVLGGDEEEISATVAQLLFARDAKWKDMVAALKKAEEGQEPENIRYGVLGYCKKVLSGGGAAAKRAYDIIDYFRFDLYTSGWPGLYAYCFRAMHEK